jgi:Fe(3+) dicitrate transport protein
MSSLQLTYVSSQFTEASNSKIDTNDNTYGYLRNPSYYVADFSASYKWKSWKLEAGVTNFTNNSYFTRRRISRTRNNPSDTRTFYTTLEFVF